MSQTEAALARAEADFDSHLARWLDWLRIPSISANPDYAGDCMAAAEFAARELAGMGFDVEVIPTKGQPAVLASHPGSGGDAPHLLYYGHYDVQPVDPLDLWDAPPFDPQIVDGPHGKRVVARGAVDDKGQVATWLAAFRAWYDAAGTMPAKITVLIEGEEEIGSPNLEPFIVAHRDRFAGAQIAVISDTGQWDIDTPAVTASVRGMVYMEVILKGASRDLHSGMYGGSALNAINALTHALGQIHDENGRVTIPGFYDGVADVSEAQKAAWQTLGFSEHDFLADIGLSVPAGEKDRSALERLWVRPTADINGIWGGYQGPGSKTVIASEAGAKISFRLVPGQDPAHIATCFKRFMAEHVPADATLTYIEHACSPGLAIDTANRFVAAAAVALEAEYGRKAAMIGCGGSIPVVESFRRVLGLDSLMMGFGLSDDRMHSPNEKFEMACFRHGLRSHIRLLGEMGA
jgi:acetylornithine deacetylase/succinyl-diaminopimelate desuccinylase-like protein